MNYHQLIVIALIILLIDINIGGVDIIFDFIGYLIIAIAFFKTPHPHSKTGGILSLLLSIYTVYEIFILNQSLLLIEERFEMSNEIISIFASIASIINFVCIISVSNTLVQETNRLFPKIFIGTLILFEVFVSFIFFMPIEIAEILLLIFAIFLFILHIWFIVFIWKRRKLESAKTIRAESI